MRTPDRCHRDRFQGVRFVPHLHERGHLSLLDHRPHPNARDGHRRCLVCIWFRRNGQEQRPAFRTAFHFHETILRNHHFRAAMGALRFDWARKVLFRDSRRGYLALGRLVPFSIRQTRPAAGAEPVARFNGLPAGGTEVHLLFPRGRCRFVGIVRRLTNGRRTWVRRFFCFRQGCRRRRRGLGDEKLVAVAAPNDFSVCGVGNRKFGFAEFAFDLHERISSRLFFSTRQTKARGPGSSSFGRP